MVILTVDDCDIILDMLEITFIDAGYKVARATNGVEAIEWLKSNRADIITTDINMPRMNGYELIEHLQKRDDLGNPMIVVISTEFDEVALRRIFSAGASDWIAKPFEPQQIITKIAGYRLSSVRLPVTGRSRLHFSN